MITPQELVEAGLTAAAAAGAEGAVVLVGETSHVDVRFACNTTTTNGIHWSRTVTLVAFARSAVGTARRSGVVGADDIAEMALAALADARSAPEAEDAWPLVGVGQAPLGRAFGLDPERTEASVLDPVLSSLSGAFARSRQRDIVLAGFAEHDVETTYLGTSTGVRLSHVQPTGSVNLVGRTGDGAASAWVGAPSVAADLAGMEDEVAHRLAWAERRLELDAGRYEVLLPPSAVADMMAVFAFDGLSGQDTDDGRSVFSKEGGGSRLGEKVTRLPFTLSSDPGARGSSVSPSWPTRPGGGIDRSSTTGCPSAGSTGWAMACSATCDGTGRAQPARA